MTNIRLIAAFYLLTVGACSSVKKEETNSQLPEKQDAKPEVIAEKEPPKELSEDTTPEIKTEPFEIQKIPSEWIRLTKTDTATLIYSICNGGNRLISILENDEGYNLLMHGQQEDYEYNIRETRRTEDGQILINATWLNSTEEQEFKFEWIDEENGLGRWETIFSPGFHHVDDFVSKEFEGDFPKVAQPCTDCFSVEDCEQMKRLEEE